ncbi:hypothetical protein [Corynebacterium anserum]|uniref:Uncharacterized protein n=1 Tax=Corynebacterium anserum TaxID=2684406 RepID=A0A7G7YM36_9CORY|nr:hypothetical protein [Corynebacterium anserum]MBC2681264.1 hypothetical protein [Corynebacterium anserum]QNH95556.1 hypothetical protein GP473_01555 [Corynebacterium anserum]
MSENNRNRKLPREVYMRRRIAAVVALILVVLLIAWIISALSGGDESNTTQSTDAAATSSTTPNVTSPNEPPNSGKNAKKSEDKTDTSASQTSKNNGKETCSVEDLQITARPGAVTFGADQQPNFFATVKNPTNADCVIDMDDNQLKFEVFTLNNYERVWADLDCNRPDVTGEVKIAPGKSVNYELGAWSKTTSAPNQCDNRQPVGPGSYLLYAHVGDNVSEPATFNLS